MLTQYYDSAYINTTNLAGSQPDWFDTTNPLPSTGNVTDSVVRAEVKRYVAAHGYEQQHHVRGLPAEVRPRHDEARLFVRRQLDLVRRPRPGLLRVSQQLLRTDRAREVLDRAVPELQRLPGQRLDGGAEHDALHGPRDARSGHRSARQRLVRLVGAEADDKCAWTGLFISGGYGYQPEWSNSAHACVQ